MLKRRKFLSLLLAISMLISLLPTSAFAASDDSFMMTVNDKGYLETQGFNIFLYSTDYSSEFGDQKCSAMEMILHGNRIATNGNVNFLPTPEQWDRLPTPTVKSHTADKQTNKLSAEVSVPDYNFDYTIEVTPEAGGAKVTLNLAKPLPEILKGRAGFSLEFLPSVYTGKSYRLDDGSTTGIFPERPNDQMVALEKPANDPIKQPDYVQQWNEERGPWQATPMATGSSITMAPEDKFNCVTINSDNEKLSLYDGRNRAQNGWFVVRTMIPSDKTDGAVVWHIRPKVQQNWTREPVVAHSQAGYAPNLSKVAVIELDPKFVAPKTAKVVRLEDDGTYTTAFEGPIADPVAWNRYNYSKFDFSSVKTPGMYAIEYAGNRTDLFPIADNAYDKVWQSSLDSFLAIQMDHMKVRDGYRIWHATSHMDDAVQCPRNVTYFDYAGTIGENLDSPYEPGQRIPGLDVGGWFDAGDYDNQMTRIAGVIQDLSRANMAFNLKDDNLTVDWDAHSVEMHRPDGVPDVIQQVKHGILMIVSQIDAVGHMFKSVSPTTLRQYTHIGDAGSETDGYLYDNKLGVNDIQGDYSGKKDDRIAVTVKDSSSQFSSIGALAAASYTLKGFDDELAKKCLDYAIQIWKGENHTATSGWGLSSEWNAAIQLIIATNGGAEYKDRIVAMAPSMYTGWQFGSAMSAVDILPYMDDKFKNDFKAAVKSYLTSLDSQVASMPFGVPATYGMWGGTSGVCDMGIRMYFLHKAFPDIVSSDYTLRVANYILGTHPCSSTSWVSGIGTSSKKTGYGGNNRADNTFVPGGVIPGYVTINPDFPECIDDFGMLWFEDEYVIDTAAKWVLVGNAVNDIVKSSNVNVPVTGVTMSSISLNASVGDSIQLTAAVAPANASNKNVTWSTSNSAIAVVDNTGKVTAVAPGTTNINVTTADGNKTATCVITVSKSSKPFGIETTGVLGRDSGILAKVKVNLIQGIDTHPGEEVVVFQLMKGDTPVSIVALQKDITSSQEFIAHFNVEPNDKTYKVKAFVLDSFNIDPVAPISLAQSVSIQ